MNMGLARLRSMEASFFSLIASFFCSPRTLSWMFFMTPPFLPSGMGNMTETPGTCDGT